MANQPKTPVKGFRIPDDLYRAAQAKAAENNESLTDVVRRALAAYADYPLEAPEQPAADD